MPRRASDQPADFPVLSIRQPWADLILSGRKTIEIRKWEDAYRGPLWIHTGQKPDTFAVDHFGMRNSFLGGLVGSVELTGILPFSQSLWAHLADSHLDPGGFNEDLAKYGWLMSKPKILQVPIPLAGELKLFRLPPALLETTSIVAHARTRLQAG